MNVNLLTGFFQCHKIKLYGKYQLHTVLLKFITEKVSVNNIFMSYTTMYAIKQCYYSISKYNLVTFVINCVYSQASILLGHTITNTFLVQKSLESVIIIILPIKVYTIR